MWRKCFLFTSVVLSLVSLQVGLAAEGSPTPPDGTERISALIEQLEHAAFTERQAASQNLAEAGVIALPHLEVAAASGSREAAGRALEVVKQHFHGSDADLKNEAREVLSRLANSENVAMAQRARNVLDPPKTSMLPPGFPFPNMRGVPFIPQFTRTQTAHENDGKREVEVRENGRKTKIQTLPNGQIQFEFTEQINGRDATRRIDAKDLSELKRKDAEAGQLYELYDAAPRRFAPRPAAPWPLVPQPEVPLRTSNRNRG